MESNQWWLLAAVIIVAIAAIGGFWALNAMPGTAPAPVPTAPAPVFTIGVLTPLSGQLANYGIGTKNAIELAVQKIDSEASTGDASLRIIFEDSPCDPTTALTAVNKLWSVDHVDAVIGPMCSSELLAIAPFVESHRLLTLTSATSPDVTAAGDYVFRVGASAELRSKRFAEFS
ncbi:MAG: ABC transporter substrate-binding protein, partial [Candidatus Diapherotrites archaeon]|nr:ABC transporter substrate-binding protein [Candidatus Diapherotrites archaeon]